MVRVRSQSLQMPRRMEILVWFASWACRLRHPCPITETCWQAGTNANHLARLAFDLIPCDKYNHCGGEGLFRITAPKQLSGWPPSLPNGSQVHLEEKPHLTLATLYFPILAGKRVTDSENNSSPSFQELTTIRIP